MTETKNAIWDTIIKCVKNMQSQNEKIVLYTDAQKVFDDNFEYYYEKITREFMSANRDEEFLDRHKVGAIIICSVLDSKIVGIGKEFVKDKEDEFLGNEKIAFEVALSYMYIQLRQNFTQGKIPYENIFEHYILPHPFSCDRTYGEVICRDLYLSKENFKLNPLLLANLLFFIEEYSFVKSGIKRLKKND